jgi:hypothetical protein
MRIASQLHLRTRRAVLAAGGAALVGCATLGVISLGVANAQASPPAPLTLSTAGDATFVTMDAEQLKQQQDKFINTLAARLGVSSDKLQQALKDTQQEVGPVPLLGGIPKDAIGIQGKTISISSPLAPAAKAIGISEDQLRQELAGTSLTDVAKAHNVDPQKVASAIKTARETDLDQAVQSGKLPTEVANTIKANLDREIELLMSMVRSAAGGSGDVGAGAIRIVLNDATAP